MRTRRRTKWRLEPAGGGLYDVLRNGRRLRSNLLPRAAEAYVRAHMETRDKVVLVERDGYETTVALLARPTEEL